MIGVDELVGRVMGRSGAGVAGGLVRISCEVDSRGGRILVGVPMLVLKASLEMS